MKQDDAKGVCEKGHYHGLNRPNNIFSWSMQVWACLCPIKITGSLFHTHYSLVSPNLLQKFFSKATYLSSLRQNISL